MKEEKRMTKDKKENKEDRTKKEIDLEGNYLKQISHEYVVANTR